MTIVVNENIIRENKFHVFWLTYSHCFCIVVFVLLLISIDSKIHIHLHSVLKPLVHLDSPIFSKKPSSFLPSLVHFLALNSQWRAHHHHHHHHHPFPWASPIVTRRFFRNIKQEAQDPCTACSYPPALTIQWLLASDWHEHTSSSPTSHWWS